MMKQPHLGRRLSFPTRESGCVTFPWRAVPFRSVPGPAVMLVDAWGCTLLLSNTNEWMMERGARGKDGAATRDLQ